MRVVVIVLFLVLITSISSTLAHADTSPNSPQGSPSAFGLGPVTEFTLANGMRVLVAPSKAADLVSLDVWVDAGTRHESADTSGSAHFLEHLLFKGTPTRKPGDIDAAIEDLGGTLNAATSYDWAHFYVTVGSDDAAAALDVLSDAILNASLRQSDMDVERQVILTERARELSSPEDRTLELVNSLLFPDHPYGRPLLGSLAQINALQRQTVLDFYKTYYSPQNATLVISGNITPEAGLNLAKQYFGKWSNKTTPSDKEYRQTVVPGIQSAILYGGSNQGYLTMGFHAPSVHDVPDAWVMDVLLTWLGQGPGNILESKLRDQARLVTEVSANYLTQNERGSLTITAGFSPGRSENVRASILQTLKQVTTTELPQNEVDAAKRRLIATYLFDAETTSGRADALGFYNTISSYDYDTQYLNHVLSVTSSQVLLVAKKYLDINSYAMITLQPRVDPIEASLPAP